jgi:hypothetical protein
MDYRQRVKSCATFAYNCADFVGAAEGCDRPGTGRRGLPFEARSGLIAAFGSSYRDYVYCLRGDIHKKPYGNC